RARGHPRRARGRAHHGERGPGPRERARHGPARGPTVTRQGAAALAALGLALPLLVAWSASDAVEAAYRANNVGVALLEQFRHDDVVASFRKALELDPALALARANLAIALLNVPKLEEARLEARAAAAALPGVPQPQ